MLEDKSYSEEKPEEADSMKEETIDKEASNKDTVSNTLHTNTCNNAEVEHENKCEMQMTYH